MLSLKHLIVAPLVLFSMADAGSSSAQESPPASEPRSSDRVAVNGVELYYEVHGEGPPLVMLHGGVNPSDMFGAPLAAMSEAHTVYAVHLRGHGFSSDAAEPWSYEQMADDVAALLAEIALDDPDILGWSLGGGVALQLAIRHPDAIGKLVVVSMNVRAEGNFPEVQAEFDAMPEKAAEYARGVEQSPLAELYPDIDWKVMFEKTGAMGRVEHDWTAEVAKISAPTLLMFSDADMMPPEHIVEIYKLFGGGTQDAGVDGSKRPTANQLAIIPGTTHYDLMLKETKVATDLAKAFLAQ